MSVSEWTGLLFISPLLKPVTTSPHLLLPSPNPTIHTSLASPSFTTPSPTAPLISTQDEQCPLSITPPSLVVRYGDPVSANCSIMGTDYIYIGWEVPELIDASIEGDMMVPFLVWTVKTMNEWSVRPTCFRLNDHSGQCVTQLDLTVHKPPDSVSISYVNHIGPELEAQQYSLQCQVQDVAPVENLTVTFYRGQKALAPPQSSNRYEKTPVSETFFLNLTSSIEDDGAIYWCEAKLDLGPDGPQPPPVVKSNHLTATVYFGPQFLCPAKLQVRLGDELTCEVRGNPSPSVTWHRDGQVVVPPTHSNGEHAGKYTVSAQGALGKFDFTLDVEVLTAKGTSNDCGIFLVAVLIQLIYWL